MKTKLFILLPILVSALAGCGSQKCDHEYSYFISRNSDKRTYIVGDQFDPTGLQVSKKCSKCGQELPLEAFNKGNSLYGRRSFCRECEKKIQNTPEKISKKKNNI